MKRDLIATMSLRAHYEQDPEFLMRHILWCMIEQRIMINQYNESFIQRDQLQKKVTRYFTKIQVDPSQQNIDSLIAQMIKKHYLQPVSDQTRTSSARLQYLVNLDQLYVACSICGLHYIEEHWAGRCEAYCIHHLACSMEIAKHSIEAG